jgi:hypothetical protein
MDQGIIQTLKLKFRKRQLKQMVREMEVSSKCGSEILKNISLLDAIYWIDRSWAEVETSTIVKCFRNCGFINSDCTKGSKADDHEADSSDDADEDDVPLAVLQLSRDIFGCEFKELVQIDANMKTCADGQDWDKCTLDIIKDISEEKEEEVEEDTESEKYESVMSRQEFCESVNKMKRYASVHGHEQF